MQSKSIGNIITLFIASKENKETIEKIKIDVDEKGIIGDSHYDKDINRSILLTATDSYAMVKEKAIEIQYGALGENLLIDFNPYKLPIGTKLQIGTAILEITQPCTLCNHLSSIDKKVPMLLKNDRGIFAKVIQAGTLHHQDQIYILE